MHMCDNPEEQFLRGVHAQVGRNLQMQAWMIYEESQGSWTCAQAVCGGSASCTGERL